MSRVLIKFDLSSIPAGATITNAKMSLYTNKIAESCCTPGLMMAQGSKYAYKVTKSWDERTVNYNNQPTAGTANVATCTNTKVQAWEDFDVTVTVKEMYSSPNTNYGFMIKCGEAIEDVDVGILLYSSEYSVQTNRPKLTVTYTPSSSITNPIKGKITPAKEYEVAVFNLQGKELSSFVMIDISKLNTMLPVGVNVVTINGQKMKMVKR